MRSRCMITRMIGKDVRIDRRKDSRKDGIPIIDGG
jgi:hypothetical protein